MSPKPSPRTRAGGERKPAAYVPGHRHEPRSTTGQPGLRCCSPYDGAVGAGTNHTATTLRSLPSNSDTWRILLRAGLPPSHRRPLRREPQPPAVLLPVPGAHEAQPDNIQDLYLGSLRAIGIDPDKHDVRFVETTGKARRWGAWGLGWEVAQRHGGHAVHVFPAGGRLRVLARARGDRVRP